MEPSSGRAGTGYVQPCLRNECGARRRGDKKCGTDTPRRPSRVSGFDYRGSRVILPAIGTPPKEVHPLMFWWAIFYTFIRCPCSLAITRKRGRSLPTPLRPSLPCPSSTSWKWLKTQFRTCSGAPWSLLALANSVGRPHARQADALQPLINAGVAGLTLRVSVSDPPALGHRAQAGPLGAPSCQPSSRAERY
jgi:hypothetical protein